MFAYTGDQRACLNKRSWQKLVPEVDVSAWGEKIFLRGSIHGVPAKLHFGQGRTEGVNMVGKDSLSAAKLMLIADYNLEGCLLLESTDTTQGQVARVACYWYLTRQLPH